MTYRGQVRNGVVVFEGQSPLEEGTTVNVEPVQSVTAGARDAKPGSREALMGFRERWVGPPGELDRLLAEVQETRDADLTPASGDE